MLLWLTEFRKLLFPYANDEQVFIMKGNVRSKDTERSRVCNINIEVINNILR